MSSNRSSLESSSKRNPLVRSLRAKSSSSTSSYRKKSLDTHQVLLEIDELTDEREAAEGLTPPTLKQWILSKGKSYGSVYLLPFAYKSDNEDSWSTKMAPSGYRYRIVGTNQPSDQKHFYTLSVTGVTSFLLGEVGFLSLDQWVAEYWNYEKLRTISFFFRFKKSKSFETWKCVVKRQKFVSASKKLAETSSIFGNAKMRHCFMQVQGLVGKLTDMGVTEILQRKTYDIDDFFAHQLTLTADFAKNFGDFRQIVCQLVLDTCKSTFTDAGFSSDDYILELAEVERQAQKEYAVGSLSSSSRSSSSLSHAKHPKPRKLTFIEQVNKRKVCERIARFLRLIDFMMRFTAHMIVANSLIAVHKSLISRARSRSTAPARGEGGEKDLEKEASVESDTEIPVFSCKVILVGDSITITPDLQRFDDGFHNFLGKLNDAVSSVPVIFDDSVFNPYTQPILYGKMEDYKDDYEQTPFIHGHDERCAEIMLSIRNALIEAFQLCDQEMECYKATAREFSDAAKGSDEPNVPAASSKLVDVETDVDSLKSKLANLTDQQALAKGIKDQQNMSIFRADFKPLKRTILPNISKTIIQMQDALPKLGREKMEQFNEDCKSLKDMIDFELKTSEDYVDNMNIKEKLQARFANLQSKLEAIENVYLIMKNIPVPVSTEDKNSLKNLKSQLKSLGSKVEDKIKAHADILDRFAETLESEQLALKDAVASLLQEVRSPALLELEATADEVKPTLAKIEQMLKQSSAKVLQYNQYEKTYGFHITEYLELVAAEQILAATNTVWKCTEDWEVLYTKWASVEFSQLEVDDCEEGTAMIELELEEAKEIIGSSPMSLDLMAKVHATTEKLPVLKDLRTPALKERHWKQISEVVGADLTSTGKKLTLEILEKYNVFAYGKEIARIVRAASQEEQLDCMVNDLKNTWTEQKMVIKMVHGVPTVGDFVHLHTTVLSSVVTLKELGQSRYSTQMKDSLLYWCDVVERAERFVWLLAKTQDLWMYQEVPMTSMLLGRKHPSTFAYFKLLRQKFFRQMSKVAEADALISAFGDQDDYLYMNDVLLGFRKMESLLDSVLWSLRADSPRLYFLTRSDLLSMLYQCHNDVNQMYRYIVKIYPAISSLKLLENTNLEVDKTGYHPEIEGVISKDGEKVIFSEVMKARLGVEHWVKYLGIHLRFTLRSQLRSFFRGKKFSVSWSHLAEQWSSLERSTQMHLVSTHTLLCQILASESEVPAKNYEPIVREMKSATLETIKSYGFNEIQKKREIAKLLQLEYYLELGWKSKTCQEVLDAFLVRYTWENERQIIRVCIVDNHIQPYGYEYNGQTSLFDPSLASDRMAFSLLTAVTNSGGIGVLQQDARKKQLASLCYIFGRPIFFVNTGIQDNFGEALVGSIITNSWIYVSVDELDPCHRPLLRTALMQLEISMRFKEEFLELFGQEISLGGHTNMLIARTSLLSGTTESVGDMLKRFRQISLTPLPLNMKIRLGLLTRGVSDKGLSLFLIIIIDRFLQFEEELGPQCIVVKMLNAIKLSISTTKLGIMQKFFNQGMDAEVMRIKMNIGQLVLDDDVYDIIRRHAKMTSEFKSYFEEIRNPSVKAAATSQAMVENCIALQTSVSNFSVTCVVYPKMTNTIRRTLRATETFLANQTGCTVFDICSQTQLFVGDTLEKVLKAAKEGTGILHVYGKVNVTTISLLRNIASEYNTLKVLFSCNDKNVLNEINAYINCVKLKDDVMYNMLTAMAPCLSERLFGVVDKHFKIIFPVLTEGFENSRALSEGRIIPNERSFAILVGTSLASRVTNQEQIGNMLHASELLVAAVKESIDEAHSVFRREGNLLGDQLELEPHVGVSHGQPSIFIPTVSVFGITQVLHYFMENHISTMILGNRGCGKSLSLSKVVPHLSTGMTVKYIVLGDRPDYSYEVGVLRKLTSYRNNVVVIENFDPRNVYHVHFIISLTQGRTFFDERAEKFQRLSNLTLLIEGCCDLDEVPLTLSYNMVFLKMAKEESCNQEVLSKAFSVQQPNLSENLTTAWESLAGLLWSWHSYVASKNFPLISDHVLYRALNGIISCLPEDIESKEDLLKFVQSEILNEYLPFVPTTNQESFVEELSTWKDFAEINKDEDEILFFYQVEDHHSMPLVQVKTMPDSIKGLMQSYAGMRGKQYNDRLVLSSHFTRQIVSMMRSFCRYGTVAVIGPPGCGKTSAVKLCANMLDMDIVKCPLTNFAALVKLIKETYCMANNENPRMILVQMNKADEEAFQALDLLNKMFHYYDIPGAFDTEEKMKQLFDDDTERKDALLDNKAMVDAQTDLGLRIKENLHLVVTMTPTVLEQSYARFSNLFNKSGLVKMAALPEETLVAIAEERFAGLEKDLNIPIRNVSKACAIIHLQMCNETVRKVTSTQYLDMVKILPQLYKPLQKKLLQIRQNLQTGIDQVLKANTYITKLSNEISEKEPEVLRLNTEIEQLNKRLSQERINLEKASKSFRKKEVAARKKSEETQDLAADAHRNLEHALPSLEAAMQAVNGIDKGELNDLRSMKNPPELAQQVLEAVCILLGLKADWNTAKMVTGDGTTFIQKLLDFDKDNIPEQVSKRVRRYIDNPKFIPDEVAKVSRLSSSLCMWVRAIDLYAKIFKSIEPKRIRLLQAESELAEAMAALREETDRVAHIESTITSIQSNQQERVKRKANLEANIKQTAARLERAQLLSYSLEEESERWKATLIEVDKSLQMLVGNTVVAAMIVAYSGCMKQNERRLMVEKWRKICDRCKLETTVVPANDFIAPIMTPLKHWIGKFEFYCQNYLSMRLSNKWPLLQDPHGLAYEAMRAQNDSIIVVGINEDRLVDVLRQAISKGHEVMVLNYDPSRLRPGLRAVFHRELTERIHAFVGLMGIPIMRRDHRVKVDGVEVVCNPKFKLLLHSPNVQEEVLPSVKNIYNAVLFDYSVEALELLLLKKVMIQINLPFSQNYEETVNNIRHLEQTVVERKDNVLDILLKTEEDVLDDKSVIVSLKDAKAKVFEILNDLNQEKKEMLEIEQDLPTYRLIAQKLRGLINILDLLFPNSNASPLPVGSFIKLIEETTLDDEMETEEKILKFLPTFLDKVSKIVLPSLPSEHRYILQMGCNIILKTKSTKPMSSSFEVLIKKLFEVDLHKDREVINQALIEYVNPVNENEPHEEETVKEQFDALLCQDQANFNQVIQVEQTLIEGIDSMSQEKALLIYSDISGSLDVVDVICDLARVKKLTCPKYVSADLLTSLEVANLIVNSKKERRWLIIDNFTRVTHEIVESIPVNLSGDQRLFFVAMHHNLTFDFGLNNKVKFISMSHAPKSAVRKSLYLTLLKLRGIHEPNFLEGVLRLHEYLSECYPNCDQYRYLNIFVKKWQQRGSGMTPEHLLALINESYDLDDSSDHHQLLKSILREISFINSD